MPWRNSSGPARDGGRHDSGQRRWRHGALPGSDGMRAGYGACTRLADSDVSALGHTDPNADSHFCASGDWHYCTSGDWHAHY